jgi:nickel transport protein
MTRFPSKRLSLMLALVACLLLPAAAQAHKVNVFAYVDGHNIVLDCFFSKNDRVHGGAVTVLDASTGEELAHGTTDDKGALSLPVPPKAIVSGHDLKIQLKAGEGHQSDTVVQASEFAGLKAEAPAAKPAVSAAAKENKLAVKQTATPQSKTTSAATPPVAAPVAAPAAIDEATLTRIVEQAVDSRMAPVKRMLQESAEKGTSPTEVAGGIGYIVGLFGIAAFVASKRKDHNGK